MTDVDPDQLDAEIRQRIADQLAERAQRRERLKRVRAEFDDRRRRGVDIRNQRKLERLREEDQT